MRTRSKNFDISVSQLHVCESRLAACEKRCRQLEWKNEASISCLISILFLLGISAGFVCLAACATSHCFSLAVVSLVLCVCL